MTSSFGSGTSGTPHSQAMHACPCLLVCKEQRIVATGALSGMELFSRNSAVAPDWAVEAHRPKKIKLALSNSKKIRKPHSRELCELSVLPPALRPTQA